MTGDTTAFVTAFLLALGVAFLALAVMVARYSMRDARHRGAILAVLGGAALATLLLVLRGTSWTVLWEDTLLPLLILLAAAGAGLALGAALVYVLVAAR